MIKTIISVLAVCSLAACGAAAQCKDPANANSATCTAVNVGIDCTKGEIPSVVDQFGPVVDKLIGEATGADGTVDWGHVETMLGSLGVSYGTCVVGEIIEKYMTAPPKLAPGEVRPSVAMLKEGFSHARVTLWKLDPSVKVHTSKGDL